MNPDSQRRDDVTPFDALSPTSAQKARMREAIFAAGRSPGETNAPGEANAPEEPNAPGEAKLTMSLAAEWLELLRVRPVANTTFALAAAASLLLSVSSAILAELVGLAAKL